MTPRQGSPRAIRQQFQRFQFQVGFGLISGYVLYYLIRITLSAAKKPLLDLGIVSLDDIGLMGTAFYITYAFGKIANGFFADYVHIARFIAWSLFCSAAIEIMMGINTSGLFLILLFAGNGWFQSVGSAPCCVALFQWFPPKQRGTGYAIWGGLRYAGEGMAWILTSIVISTLGLSAAFIGSGLAALLSGVCVWFFLKDRPQTYGFSDAASMYGEEPEVTGNYHHKQTFMSQCFVLKQPVLWLIAIACGCMYLSRYSLSSWGALFLQEEKGYSLIDAGIAMSIIPLAAAMGALLSGTLSDYFFKGNRNIPTLFYGVLNLAGFYLFFIIDGNRLYDSIALFLSGFALGGLLVFLAGLNACDLLPKNAVGAIKGFLGIFSYLAAALQEYLSSQLIHVDHVAGVMHYDFTHARYFWFASALLTIFFSLMTWPFKNSNIQNEVN